MVELTITVDEQLLKSARDLAAQEGTSVDTVLREHLERYAGENTQYEQATRRILDIAKRSTAVSNGKRWTRSDLYRC
uniref:Ribbon-helix-helix protein CopG domain-containing protein n=1 Tax=uncultured Thiotrichaceae bacterium TaxID=298394 RepID=A0A6S6T780_9GAMM|nr:MAG: Unknown protein [uncultured Thiotrichaceae bacterium]